MGTDQSQAVQIGSAPPSAVVRWLEDHGDALYQFAILRVRRADLAEDIVQETLLAALSAKGGFSAQSSERTWLIGILKHKIIDHLRKSIREQQRTETELDASPDYFDKRGHWKVSPGAWKSDPHDALENTEFRAVLESCLSKLPARIAQIFWLREAEGFDSDWLCRELQVSPTNLWTMMHRARLGLRRCLGHNWFQNDKK